jgi:hypothetical protein
VFRRKRLAALGACEWLLSRVHAKMDGKVTATRKRLGTGGALEGLLLGVRSDVHSPA